MSKSTLAKATPFTLIAAALAFLILAAIAIATPAKAESANYPGTYNCRESSDGTQTIVTFGVGGPAPSMVKAWGDGCGNERSITPNTRGEYVLPSTCHWNFTFQIDSLGYWEYVPNVTVPDANGQQRAIMNYKGSGCKVENTVPLGKALGIGAALAQGKTSAPAYPPPRR